MDNITLFHYRAKDTILHMFNPLLKLLFMLVFSISVIFLKPESLLFLFVVIIFLFFISKMSIINIAKQAKIFFILLLFMFFSYAVVQEGTVIFSFYIIKLYDISSIKGAVYCFKFILILLCGLIFAETTSPWNIQCAVYFLLKPVPLINSKRIASIAGITFTLLPNILDNYKGLQFALKSRCLYLNKNLYLKIKIVISSLLLKSLFTVKNTANSYYSRCYDEDSLPYSMQLRFKDFILFSIFIMLVILVIVSNFLIF